VASLISDDKNVELTHSSLRALKAVQDRPSISLSQVSETLSWTAEKTAFILNGLEQKRLIRSEYVNERTKNGQERKRRLFPVGGQKRKSARSPRTSPSRKPPRIEGILSHARRQGFDATIENRTRGGDYLIRLRPRREKRSRGGSPRKPPTAPKKAPQTGYQEGSRAVRPRRRRNKS
jgi:hypothetical protein